MLREELLCGFCGFLELVGEEVDAVADDGLGLVVGPFAVEVTFE